MHSNKYTVAYAVGITVAVAVMLSLAATGLRARQDANVAEARRSTILSTVMEVDPETLEADYQATITERVFDSTGTEVPGVDAFDLDILRESRKAPDQRRYPVYTFNRNGQTRFILPLHGAGLWGPISAYLAVESDLTTIYGVRFEHEKETPGLGAEITTDAFESQFEGKQLMAPNGALEGIRVVKGGASGDDEHAVDGLTGATMTMNGVTAMFRNELALYQDIFEELEP